MKKLTELKMYTWESINKPCLILKKDKAIDMYHVLLENGERHYIDIGNLIELKKEHKDSEWCRHFFVE